MAEHIDNIGERGARRRRRNGWMWTAVTVLAIIALIATRAPRASRLFLAVPVGLAATGFLQAREKTWVALAALGQCDTDEDGRKRQLSAREVAVARRQALSVVVRAMLIAAIAAAIAWAV